MNATAKEAKSGMQKEKLNHQSELTTSQGNAK